MWKLSWMLKATKSLKYFKQEIYYKNWLILIIKHSNFTAVAISHAHFNKKYFLTIRKQLKIPLK